MIPSTHGSYPSPLTLAIHYNNEGTYHLKKGDYETAINELLSALRLLKKAMRASSYDDARPCNMGEYSSLQTSPFSYEVGTERDFEEFPSTYIYRNPLRIKCGIVTECRDSCNKVASTIVFNLALVYHLRGVYPLEHGRKSRDEDLKKSVCFYEKAFVLQQNEKCGENGIRSLATLNNLAHVHYLVRNDLKANTCWHMLLSLIVIITDSCRTNVSVDEVSCFLGSVTHLILKDTGTAPAA